MASRRGKPATNYTGAKTGIIMDSNIQYEKLIEENMDKGFQVRLVVNDFRETTYIQLRKYFLSYEGEWVPSREGVSIPASLENMRAIIDGMLDICAKAEGEEIIQHYYQKIKGTE
jgi:hypothetical protein